MADLRARRNQRVPMKNPFRNLLQLQRDLGDIAVQVTQTHLYHFGVPKGWAPALNAFRCGNHFIVCVELAGVEKSELDVRAESRRLVIRGHRPLPEPACDEAPAIHVLALEIDHGPFERILELPAEVEPDRVSAEHRNGLLWIKLPLRAHA
jgi:HSP20 family protein